MTKYGLTPEQLLTHINSTRYNRFGETGIQCVLTLKNGYTVTGESSCIDPSIFDENIGRQIAYDNAFDKLWPILGYQEKQRWYEETQLNWADRVRIELDALLARTSKLDAVLFSVDGSEADRPSHIDEQQWALMHKQYKAMKEYKDILFERWSLTLNK